jgi:NADPH:quinone reductase-like Zn-dependent oxidoreductase
MVSGPRHGANGLKAITQDRFGTAEVLALSEVAPPVPDATSVLVRVRAASVNALDYRMMLGTPVVGRLLFGMGLRRPKRRIRGVDVAGTVESVSASIEQFRPGDEVFGLGSGSFAEFVAADVKELARKPPSLSFREAASLPIAGVTALQAVRDKARVQPGQSVLVIGAGGGVGTFAVQIARAMGARVTAVTSGENAELLTRLGAERVLDYSREDYTRGSDRFDAVVDILGDRPLRACLRLLRPGGVLVVVGGAGLGRFLKALLLAKLLRRRVVGFIARVRPPELDALARLATEGKLRPVIERTYPLEATAEAMRYASSHRAKGKLVIDVGGP